MMPKSNNYIINFGPNHLIKYGLIIFTDLSNNTKNYSCLDNKNEEWKVRKMAYSREPEHPFLS